MPVGTPRRQLCIEERPGQADFRVCRRVNSPSVAQCDEPSALADGKLSAPKCLADSEASLKRRAYGYRQYSLSNQTDMQHPMEIVLTMPHAEGCGVGI